MTKRKDAEALTVDKGRVTTEEVVEWVALQVQGQSLDAISKAVGRNRKTVTKHLAGREAVALRKQFTEETAARIKARLLALSDRAVRSWEAQLDLADEGKRANHQVAKDLLTHAGAVDIAVPAKEKETQILIQIGCGSPDEIEFIEVPDDRADVGLPKTIVYTPDDEPVEDVRDE